MEDCIQKRVTVANKVRAGISYSYLKGDKRLDDTCVSLTPASHPDELFVVSISKKGYTTREYFIPQNPKKWAMPRMSFGGTPYTKYTFSTVEGHLMLDIAFSSASEGDSGGYKNILLLDNISMALIINNYCPEKEEIHE